MPPPNSPSGSWCEQKYPRHRQLQREFTLACEGIKFYKRCYQFSDGIFIGKLGSVFVPLDPTMQTQIDDDGDGIADGRRTQWQCFRLL